MENLKKISPEKRIFLLETLKNRFEKNRNRHKEIDWANVQAKLELRDDKLF